MSDRDDMVMRPSIGPQKLPSTRTRAQIDREIDRSKKSGRGLYRLARRAYQVQKTRRMAERAAKARRARVIAARTGRAGRAVRAGAATARAARLGGRAALNPVGALIAAIAVAGIVTGRLVSGRSFDNMGAEANRILLGDFDDEARAAMQARGEMMADSNILAFAGKRGITEGMREMFEMRKKLALDEIKGRSLFSEDPTFQVNGTLDMLILRAQEKITGFWQANIASKLSDVLDGINDLFFLKGWSR